MSALLVMLLLAAPAQARAKKAEPPAQDHPVDIKSDHLKIHGKKNEAEWLGHVKAVRESTTLTCDKMITHYGAHQEITRLECIGNVVAVDGDKTATGGRADFDNLSGVLVVTEEPVAHQGPNWIKGTKVTFYAGQDEIDVENAVALVRKKSALTPPPKGSAP
jgi:lipopolysaccharide export system protein LptA